MLTLRQIADLKRLEELRDHNTAIESVERRGQELTVRFMDAVSLRSEDDIGSYEYDDLPMSNVFKIVETTLDCGSVEKAEEAYLWLIAEARPF